MPDDGNYVAFFIDITFQKKDIDDDDEEEEEQHPTASRLARYDFPNDFPGRLEFTTEVSIIPTAYRYDDCFGTDCYGGLV